MVVEISTDEKGEQARYMPTENVDHLSLGVMIDRLESRGKWKIDLDFADRRGEMWTKAMEVRSRYLKESREILLKDL